MGVDQQGNAVLGALLGELAWSPTWHDLEANLGVDHHNRQRFHAAQRTCALRWLAVLWKQRHRRAEEFTIQLDRVRQLHS